MQNRIHQFIEHIRQLPTITLTDKQEQYFRSVMQAIPNDWANIVKNFSKQKINAKILNSTTTKAIKRYLQILLPLIEDLKNFNDELTAAWGLLTKKPELGADDLIPLIFFILPNEVDILKALKEKLFIAATLEMPDISYLLITLYGCADKKIELIENKEDPFTEKEKQIFTTLVNGPNLHPHIKKLQENCQAYLDYLTPFILTQIYKDKLAKLYYFRDKKNIPAAIKEIISDFDTRIVFNETIYANCNNNETLFLLLDKYKAINTILDILNNPSLSAPLKLKQVNSALEAEDELLNREGNYAYNIFLDKSANLFGVKRYYHLHIWQTAEGKFLETFKEISNRFDLPYEAILPRLG